MRLFFFLCLLAVPAKASEEAELIGCVDSLMHYSKGFGASIGRWEWAPPVDYPTVVVPADRGRKEVLYVYSEDKAYVAGFDEVPREARSARWFPFLLGPLRQGRGVFHCSYMAIQAKEPREVQCDLGEFLGDSFDPRGRERPKGDKYYHPIGFKELPQADLGPLRTAALSRILSVVGAAFEPQVESYRKALEAHKKRLADGPNALLDAARWAGVDLDWNRFAPREPDRDAPRRALQACAELSDEQLSQAARLEQHRLDTYPLPR